MKKIISAVTALTLLLGCLSVFSLTSNAESFSRTLVEIDYTGKTLDNLTAANATGEKSPLNNLYDLKVSGEGYADFKGYSVGTKEMKVLGNHSGDFEEDGTVFSISTNGKLVDGKGLITVIPKSEMSGLDSFKISYYERQYKPKTTFGLAPFYNNTVTEDGVEYFNGYDKYTFTGFKGNEFADYVAYSVYDGTTTNFPTAAMTTKPAKNSSVYVSVECTKGTYVIDGTTYTAKLESYVDDYLVATSYAMWADAPVMFYYETAATDRFDVQFGYITVTTKSGDIPVLRGAQKTEKYTNTSSEEVLDLRFVASGSDLERRNVGFEIDVFDQTGAKMDDKCLNRNTTAVFGTISGTTADGRAITAATAAQYNEAYLYALTIKGVPANTAYSFVVKPYSTASDGTVIYGTAYTATLAADGQLTFAAVAD